MTNETKLIANVIISLVTNWTDVPGTDPVLQAGFVFRQRDLVVQFEGRQFINRLDQSLQPQAEFRVKPRDPMADYIANQTRLNEMMAVQPLLSNAETIAPKSELPPINVPEGVNP